MPGAEWFPGARLNYAEHVFRGRDADGGRDSPRVRAQAARRDDAGASSTRRRAASRRRSARSGSGRATASSPTCRTSSRPWSRSIACAGLGAIWSSCSPDFGVRSVVDRFAQIEPRGAPRRRRLPLRRPRPRPARRRARAPGGDADGRAHGRPRLSRPGARPRPAPRRDAAGTTSVGEGGGEPLAFAQVPFDHPLWVLYSSGTTGLPKAIVHGHGGVLLELLKMLHLHVDLHARRPAVLVHDDGLDDVELRRTAAFSPMRRSCSTTATPGIPTSARSGTSPRRRGSPASARRRATSRRA